MQFANKRITILYQERIPSTKVNIFMYLEPWFTWIYPEVPRVAFKWFWTGLDGEKNKKIQNKKLLKKNLKIILKNFHPTSCALHPIEKS